MALKTFSPTSPGLRHLVLVDRWQLWKGEPVKVLVEGKIEAGGRNNDGRITARHMAAAISGLSPGRLQPSQFDMPARSSGWSTIPTARPSSR